MPGLLHPAYHARHLLQGLAGEALGDDIFPDAPLLLGVQQERRVRHTARDHGVLPEILQPDGPVPDPRGRPGLKSLLECALLVGPQRDRSQALVSSYHCDPAAHGIEHVCQGGTLALDRLPSFLTFAVLHAVRWVNASGDLPESITRQMAVRARCLATGRCGKFSEWTAGWNTGNPDSPRLPA